MRKDGKYRVVDVRGVPTSPGGMVVTLEERESECKQCEREWKRLCIIPLILLVISAGFLFASIRIYRTIENAEFTAKEFVTEEIEAEATATTEQTTETVTEPDTDFYIDTIPLGYAEQKALYEASNEFGVDYFTMLGLIERETNFRNIYGDGGRAYGYCQVWPKWWSGKMQDIGANDLNVPEDNFRTACAIVRELTDRYGSLAGALTAYNTGSFDGVVAKYATTVMSNAEKWRCLI